MLVWTEDYKIGLAELDAQHLMLFAVINQIDINIEAGRAGELLDDLLGALANYVQYHFEFEEAMMIAHGYPPAPDHRQGHCRLVQSLSSLIAPASGQADKLGHALKVRRFVIDWLVDHIMTEDADFARYVATERAGG
jgi:hemerythrin